MLEHVEAVALGLDEVGVRGVGHVRLAAEPPGREHQLAELTRVDGGLRARHRLRVAVVEVDAEEEVAVVGLADEPVGLVEFEHERLLGEQRNSSLNHLEGRPEVVLVG